MPELKNKEHQDKLVNNLSKWWQHGTIAEEFAVFWHMFEETTWQVNDSHGFEDPDQNFGEKIALVHSELSEALEAERNGNPESIKIPGFTHVEEELADAIIRLMNMARNKSWNLPEAILAKTIYNSKRPYKHNRSF